MSTWYMKRRLEKNRNAESDSVKAVVPVFPISEEKPIEEEKAKKKKSNKKGE